MVEIMVITAETVVTVKTWMRIGCASKKTSFTTTTWNHFSMLTTRSEKAGTASEACDWPRCGALEESITGKTVRGTSEST